MIYGSFAFNLIVYWYLKTIIIMANWKVKVTFRDLLEDYNDQNDEFDEIERIKPLWIERFNGIPVLKRFVKDIEKVKTEAQFNKFLNNVYDYCDDNLIWIKF